MGCDQRPAGRRDDELGLLATALTGEPRRAAELVAEVRVLAGEQRSGDGELDERALLVSRLLHRRRRWAATPSSAEDEPWQSSTPPELAAVLARLDRLPPLDRALLVLRYRERLTLHELAGLVDRPVVAVARGVERAEGAVAAEPYQVVAALATLPGVDPAAVRSAERRFTAGRRHSRSLLALAATTALVLLGGATVLPGVLERRATYVRPYGAWVHGFYLEAGASWRPGARTLTADRDSLVVRQGADERRSCLVDLIVSRTPLAVPDGERARVRGRPAALVAGSGAAAPYLWWSVNAHSAAVIGCSSDVGTKTLLDLARRVRLRPVPARLPFDLHGVDHGFQVRFLSTRSRSVVALAVPAGRVSRTSTTVYVSVPGANRIPEDRQQRSTVTVQGRPGTLDRARNGGMALCWPVQHTGACVSAYVFREAADRDQTRLRAELDDIAEGLAFAPVLADANTWFDARDALPG